MDGASALKLVERLLSIVRWEMPPPVVVSDGNSQRVTYDFEPFAYSSVMRLVEKVRKEEAEQAAADPVSLSAIRLLDPGGEFVEVSSGAV